VVPVHAAGRGDAVVTASGPDDEAGEPTRLLLVEDNAADARVCGEMLRSALPAGFELSRTERLVEACDRLGNGAVSCVLLDLSLPDAHGLEAVTRIRTAAPNVPIVVLTGTDDERLALAAVQHGAQ